MQSSPSNTLSYKNDPQISQYEITPYKSSNKQITSMKLPNNTDLIPGKYEGGLKIWECSLDLIDFLPSVFANLPGVDKATVLDLGCGHGFGGLYFALKGANVVFQDFNPEVLEQITKSYIIQIKEKYNVDLMNKCMFASGDWGNFTFNGKFDVIVSGDTLYNVDNYDKIYNILKTYLDKNGRAYFATKKFYYGVGGGMNQFRAYIMEKGEFDITKVKEINTGMSNIRDILELKWKAI